MEKTLIERIHLAYQDMTVEDFQGEIPLGMEGSLETRRNIGRLDFQKLVADHWPEIYEALDERIGLYCPLPIVGQRVMKGPAYRYLRPADKLPLPDDIDGMLVNDLKFPVKWFNPEGSETWYIHSYDPESKMAAGFWIRRELDKNSNGEWVWSWEPFQVEMTSFAMFRGARFKMPMQRDIHFTGGTLYECLVQDGHKTFANELKELWGL